MSIENTPENKKRRKRLSFAKAAFLFRSPFFSTLLLRGKVDIGEVSIEMPIGKIPINTAMVDLWGDITFDPEFLDGLSDEEVIFIFAHEVLHPALGLFRRAKNIPPKYHLIANLAHDYVINLILDDIKKGDGTKAFSIPEGAALDERFKGMSFEEVYQILLKECPELTLKTCGVFLKGDALEGMKGKGSSGGEGKGKKGKEKSGGGCPNYDELSEEEKEKNERYWTETLAEGKQKVMAKQGAEGWGNMPAGLRLFVDELLNPQISWRELLSRFVGRYGRRDDYSYSKPRRGSHTIGVYLPTPTRSKPKVAILVDTSGSISMDDLRHGLSEMKSIIEDFDIPARVLSCDAEVHSDIDEVEDIDEVIEVLMGGGGSDFRPGFKEVEGEFFSVDSPIIAFTDGYITVPEYAPEAPVIWVLVDEGSQIPAEYGEVIRLHRGRSRNGDDDDEC